MDAVWSHEFVFALLCFTTPVGLAAWIYYRRLKVTALRKLVLDRTAGAYTRYLSEVAEQPTLGPQIKPSVPSGNSFRHSLHYLAESVKEVKGSITRSQAALEESRKGIQQFGEILRAADDWIHNHREKVAPRNSEFAESTVLSVNGGLRN